MLTPLISFVCTTKGRGALAKRLIAMLQAQTFRGFDLVLVDSAADPSFHESPHTSDFRLSYWRVEGNQGQRFAYGCAVAQGDYVAKLDDDDVYLENYADELRKVLEPEALIYLRKCLVQATDGSLRSKRGMAGGTLAFHRDVLKRIQIPAVPLDLDGEILRCCVRAGVRQAPQCGYWESYTWVRHGSNTSNGVHERVEDGVEEPLDEFWKICPLYKGTRKNEVFAWLNPSMAFSTI